MPSGGRQAQGPVVNGRSIKPLAAEGTPGPPDVSDRSPARKACPVTFFVRNRRRRAPLYAAMAILPDDQELDRLWRDAFGEPLPILGAAEIVVAVLARFEAKAAKARVVPTPL